MVLKPDCKIDMAQPGVTSPVDGSPMVPGHQVSPVSHQCVVPRDGGRLGRSIRGLVCRSQHIIARLLHWIRSLSRVDGRSWSKTFVAPSLCITTIVLGTEWFWR